MKILKRIIIVVVIILLLGFITAFIDYKEVNKNHKPVFTLKSYNKDKQIASYRGLFHQVEIKWTKNYKEPIENSKEIKYKIFGNQIKTQTKINQKEYLTIKTKEETKCNKSKLIYADEEIKVYTYCLEEIKINTDDKDIPLNNYLKNNKFKNISKNLTYSRMSIDESSLELIDNKNISNNGIRVIECNIHNNNDVYIGPVGMIYQEDFCTNKDDDFKFFWKIEDKNEKNFKCEENSEKEILYTDNNNQYTFDCKKSDKIYVTTPELRGFPAKIIPIKDALNNKLITIDEAIKKGLKVNKEKIT